MSRLASRAARIPKLSRFGWLMGLYAENHVRLVRLFEPQHLPVGRYVSSVGDGLDVITRQNLLDVLGSLELMDLPGINRRFKARLFAAGITTPLEMYSADARYLKSFVFFSKLGYDWHLRLRGWDIRKLRWA